MFAGYGKAQLLVRPPVLTWLLHVSSPHAARRTCLPVTQPQRDTHEHPLHTHQQQTYVPHLSTLTLTYPSLVSSQPLCPQHLSTHLLYKYQPNTSTEQIITIPLYSIFKRIAEVKL